MTYYHVGGYGYGDILLAIGCELNKSKTKKADINFICDSKILKCSKYQIYQEDPHTFKTIFQSVANLVGNQSGDIKLSYTMSEHLDYKSFGINPSEILSQYHDGAFRKSFRWAPDSNESYITLCLPDFHAKREFKVRKSYKAINYEKLLDWTYQVSVKLGLDIKIVSHSMPLSKILRTIRNGCLFIGYDGGISWLSNWTCCPTVVVSGDVHKSIERNHDVVLNKHIDDLSPNPIDIAYMSVAVYNKAIKKLKIYN